MTPRIPAGAGEAESHRVLGRECLREERAGEGGEEPGPDEPHRSCPKALGRQRQAQSGSPRLAFSGMPAGAARGQEGRLGKEGCRRGQAAEETWGGEHQVSQEEGRRWQVESVTHCRWLSGNRAGVKEDTGSRQTLCS